MNFIIVTDANQDKVRINVNHILYYKAYEHVAGFKGTAIVLSYNSGADDIQLCQETVDEIDQLIRLHNLSAV